jgi:hypothetical protein
MPTLIIIEGLKVQMYVDDHPPAHLHVILGDGEIRIAIEDGAVLSATFRPTRRQVRALDAWISEHRGELLALWNRYRGE